MKDVQSYASLAIQMYGVKALKELMKKMPIDSMLVAISRNKLASIFYKHHLGYFEADYCNGNGWTGARQVTLFELEQDLKAISFMLINVSDLQQALSECLDYPDEVKSPLEIKLNGLIESQIARAQLRCNADQSDSYWKGHIDAYEIIQNSLKAYL